MKKKWEKPQLIVLSRGKPEELVLMSCKKLNNSYSGPTHDYRFCTIVGNCWNCSVDAIS
jgi:hypothetical protein